RRDGLVPDARAAHRRPRRRARGGRRQRRQSRRHRGAVPPRDRRRRATHRLRGRHRAQALAARARARRRPRAKEPPMTTTQKDRARAFHALHHGGRILVLPNAWDAASARIFELAGAPAVATTSSGLAASLGYPDGERIPCDLGFFVNARTDVFLGGKGSPAEQLADAIRRLAAYGAAGADGLFAPGLADPDTIAQVVRAVHLPLNVMAFAGVPPAKELERLGVARVSVGAGPMRATLALTRRIAEELLGEGSYTGFLRDTLSHPEVNGMFGRG